MGKKQQPDTNFIQQFPARITQRPWQTGEPGLLVPDEHDACAIVAAVRKGGVATHGNLKRVLNALSQMGHRSGDVNGEGDGCGLLSDIPRYLWAESLDELGKPAWLAEDRRFFVGHFMLPVEQTLNHQEIIQKVLQKTQEMGADVLISRPGQTRPHTLGRLARQQEPLFWQIAGIIQSCPLEAVENQLFELMLEIEAKCALHVASLSSHTVVYKVRGSVETLYHYYPDLRSPHFTSAITLGHTRYSTNTATAFERVQPFQFLGHNGEINTIARLREQARMLGTQLVENGSDSQDLDRTIGTLIHRYSLSLTEAMEMVQPPIHSEVAHLPDKMQQIFYTMRQAFGPFAQGPAALIARHGDECTFSVDALGLRPLWFGETEKEYFFSSEKGVYFLDSLCGDPRPLSPGEKMTLRIHRGNRVEVLSYADVLKRVSQLANQRLSTTPLAAKHEKTKLCEPPVFHHLPGDSFLRMQAAFGWGQEHTKWVQHLASAGFEPIGSLGFDSGLAALSLQRHNLSDYFKESVAVVTNPSIDREREQEHFSTEVVIGPRPDLIKTEPDGAAPVILACPVLVDTGLDPNLLPTEQLESIANEKGSLTIWDLVDRFSDNTVKVLSIVTLPNERVVDGLDRLVDEAISAVETGTHLLVLDDMAAFQEGFGWIDSHLAVSVIDRALRFSFGGTGNKIQSMDDTGSEPSKNLRRQTGLVLRSGAIRDLHDLIMALGLGADAVCPTLLLEVAVGDPARDLPEVERADRLSTVLHALQVGLEKVTSTMGIHELRGYGRLFASIGLSNPVALALGCANYCGSEERGVTWEDLEVDLATRKAVLLGEARVALTRENHFYPKIWKTAGQVGAGTALPETFEEKAEGLSKELPVTLRHVLEFNFAQDRPAVDPMVVYAGLTGHDLPFVIASMSFGSQGETAFRAYAEGAYRLNMLCLNGEGGEIQDMMGKYPHNRGQQIASGRFGVDINLINSSNLLEIKIGQGAKPGEGGHLPGRKVSEKVAAARHATRGVDLISPSNNHDIYSIEDLAQFIEELKTANPKARVAVKVPVVPGIGIIAVGIAKAGADIINLTGYEGGTGAARQHAIKHVGLPAEIGVVAAHKALVESGLRGRVELWCDGGMRTAADVVKMICLGANRVGFGTLAMVAIGCTICRACQMDTCHVGIATQIQTVAQAEEHGLRRFIPRDFESATQGIVSLFGALGQQVKLLTAQLGFTHTQDLVGRTDLLVQSSHYDELDLSEILESVQALQEATAQPQPLRLSTGFQLSRHPLRRPRNHLTTVISNMVMETAITGEKYISFEDDKVSPVDRALGTHLAGAITRYKREWLWLPGHAGVGGLPESWRMPTPKILQSNGFGGNGSTGHKGENGVPSHYPSSKKRLCLQVDETILRFYASSVPGNGLGAYGTDPLSIIVEGGAQDGVGKGMHGGKLVILKGYNHDGIHVDGSVGKGLAYGAIGGMIIIQGNADSRACIRLSGADVVIGGEISQPLNDALGYLGARANVKGFLCEYMTAGRVLVLGDPGPWICAGMTGGILYLLLQPNKKFDLDAIYRRIARGALVQVRPVGSKDESNLNKLISAYAAELHRAHQVRESDRILALMDNWQTDFVKVIPKSLQMDQEVSTE